MHMHKALNGQRKFPAGPPMPAGRETRSGTAGAAAFLEALEAQLTELKAVVQVRCQQTAGCRCRRRCCCCRLPLLLLVFLWLFLFSVVVVVLLLLLLLLLLLFVLLPPFSLFLLFVALKLRGAGQPDRDILDEEDSPCTKHRLPPV